MNAFIITYTDNHIVNTALILNASTDVATVAADFIDDAEFSFGAVFLTGIISVIPA